MPIQQLIEEYFEPPQFIKGTELEERIIYKLKNCNLNDKEATKLILKVTEFLVTFNLLKVLIFYHINNEDILIHMSKTKEILNAKKTLRYLDFSTVKIKNSFNNAEISMKEVLNGENIFYKVYLFMFFNEMYRSIKSQYTGIHSNQNDLDTLHLDIIVETLQKKISIKEKIELCYEEIYKFQNKAMYITRRGV